MSTSSGNRTLLLSTDDDDGKQVLDEDVFELVSECEANHTLDPVSLRCRACVVCGAHSHRRRACDTKRDTQCECNRDYYYDEADVVVESEVMNVCRPCDLCPHGWGAHQPCSPHRNSLCSRCAPGTFSSLLSTTLACFPCSACKRHEVVYHNCTAIHDTVCIEVDSRHVKSQGKFQVLSSTPGSHLDYLHLGSSDYHSVWPIYSALLLTLLLAIVAYFVLKKWKLSSVLNHNNELIISSSSRRRRPPLAISSSSTSSAASSSACANLDELYRDICRSKRRLLENMLIDDGTGRNHWKHLALYLGYSSERIMELDMRGGGSVSSSAQRRLLNEWACQHPHSATTNALTTALNALHRQDIVGLLFAHHKPKCLCLDRATCNYHTDTTTVHRVVDIL